jgi:hypothetical protein
LKSLAISRADSFPAAGERTGSCDFLPLARRVVGVLGSSQSDRFCERRPSDCVALSTGPFLYNRVPWPGSRTYSTHQCTSSVAPSNGLRRTGSSVPSPALRPNAQLAAKRREAESRDVGARALAWGASFLAPELPGRLARQGLDSRFKRQRLPLLGAMGQVSS